MPGPVRSPSRALVLCQAWCLVADLCNLASHLLTAWWPPHTAGTYVLKQLFIFFNLERTCWPQLKQRRNEGSGVFARCRACPAQAAWMLSCLFLFYVPGRVHQQSSWAAASKVMTMSVCGNKKKMILFFFKVEKPAELKAQI